MAPLGPKMPKAAVLKASLPFSMPNPDCTFQRPATVTLQMEDPGVVGGSGTLEEHDSNSPRLITEFPWLSPSFPEQT